MRRFRHLHPFPLVLVLAKCEGSYGWKPNSRWCPPRDTASRYSFGLSFNLSATIDNVTVTAIQAAVINENLLFLSTSPHGHQ
jgi:hypothetical protein